MKIELSIVMPCLNEAETISFCINKAKSFLSDNNIQGEVVIGDNGSTDGSQEIAKRLGAIVVNIENKGYGNASIGAINYSKGKYIITADTDDSHDILNLLPFVKKLEEGFDLVIGNRFQGKKLSESMPFLHRYIGNPVLTFIGNLFFKTNIGDFHCGLRAFTREAFNKMNLTTPGMEFASEVIVKASLLNLKITEVPTTVYPSGRSRKAHLRTFPDGWRHLRFLLLYSPKWLFLIPGIFFMLLGLAGTLTTLFSNELISEKYIPLFSGLLLISFQFVVFYALTKIYATNHGLIPRKESYNKLFLYFTLERGLLLGFLLVALGVVLSFFVLHEDTTLEHILNTMVPATTIAAMGIQLILFSFFFSILGLKEEI
ncbi:glycosyltransferase family 2 protein [Sabulilitoribacter multivorans]|uniref:Glycosyltransferase family 2 protein n=1 Tax=Flaviramulus multivorans TaxID=1304750 RepID=A0ABS9IIX5_9FLAO|nr:glycosyltransferase family 2 protein [Flaviramulus multivorans]MCF7560423.1 glycosyltransferase family 2 protein [Flaviramulus multivorans]